MRHICMVNIQKFNPRCAPGYTRSQKSGGRDCEPIGRHLENITKFVDVPEGQPLSRSRPYRVGGPRRSDQPRRRRYRIRSRHPQPQ